MPEKTRPLGFEQKQGIAIWYCQSVNPAKQTGPGEAAELLRRREVPNPEKLKFITRKSNLLKPI
jgi:hypothetical protein